MIATLPMYDWPEVRPATDAWWNGIARHLKVDPPLARGSDYVLAWRDPQLLFSQTCGYPLTHEFRRTLKYVATPHYSVDGCNQANYCSMILAREQVKPENLKGSVAAVNSPDSMSGMLALKIVFAPLAGNGKFFRQSLHTGSHIASMRAVRDGKADVCAIDAVCVAMAKRYRPDYLEGLVEIARSPEVPSLPFVTRAGNVEELRAALQRAFADETLQEVREKLFLSGQTILPENAYNRILDLEHQMQSRGGLQLA